MKKFKTRWVLGHKVTRLFTSGNYDLMVAETPPNVQGPPPHLHNSYQEYFLIIEGEMEFMINGELKIVKAGETVDVPSETVHTFSNKTENSCKWINIHSPKGFFEFFDEIGIPEDEQNAQQRSVAPELIQKVIESAADYDMVMKF